jgi:hypothetical protein
MSFDHYAEATRLAEELRKEHLDCFADTIIDSMEAGATGTEIFMALRWNIGRIIKSDKCSNITLGIAQKIFDELDKSLQ